MGEIIAGILGLFIGSVLNAVADRLPPLDPQADGPFISSRPRRLALWEYLPLLSFAGAMQARRMVIANNRLRYPVLELAIAALFALSWHQLGDAPWQAVVACAFCASFLTLAAIDLETTYLPYRLSIPTLAFALAMSPFWPGFDWWEGYLAALCAFAFFYGIFLIGVKIDRPLMGDGDGSTLIGLYLTATLGGLFAIGVVISRRFGYRASVIPYGPYLVAGGLIAMFYGRTILDWVRVG
jgi:prepilin signal peptidase PulO-like enzyme (type II secretory pathway)